MTASLAAAADAGNEQILAQLGELADEAGWSRLIGIAIQITSAASVLGFGVVVAWVVGREFADGTINGLFAIPVTLQVIATAKLVVVLAWSLIVAVCLAAAVAAVGVVLGNGVPNTDAIDGLARLFALTIMSAALAAPVAWVATLGQGLLPSIALTIAIIASAQVAVVAGSGAWYPGAAPALWAITPQDVSLAQLGLVVVVTAVFAWATTRAWARLQLDR